MPRIGLRVFACFVLASAGASADLAADTDRLTEVWSRHYDVTRLAPRLLERGELLPILVPAEAADASVRDCTTVVVMSTSSTQLILRQLPSRADWLTSGWLQPSAAGVTQITRCGTRKSLLGQLFVEMRSPRAVVETLVARSRVPLPPVHRYLPHRNAGPAAVAGQPEPAIPLAGVDARSRNVQSRNRSRGAKSQRVRVVNSGWDGAGGLTLRLKAGCYTLDLLGPEAAVRTPRDARSTYSLDIDLDLTWRDGGGPPLSDRSESPDGFLEFCLGEAAVGSLRFQGSLPNSDVVVVLGSWPLPAGLARRWPPAAAARIAEIVREQHTSSLDALVHRSTGVAGITLVPVELEPDACYLGAVIPLRGESNGLELGASVGGVAYRNESSRPGRGTALAFCGKGADTAVLEVQARGSGVEYQLALWQTHRITLGALAD